jgi:hypothetical protein
MDPFEKKQFLSPVEAMIALAINVVVAAAAKSRRRQGTA